MGWRLLWRADPNDAKRRIASSLAAGGILSAKAATPWSKTARAGFGRRSDLTQSAVQIAGAPGLSFHSRGLRDGRAAGEPKTNDKADFGSRCNYDRAMHR
jgi:hypothetical protein